MSSSAAGRIYLCIHANSFFMNIAESCRSEADFLVRLCARRKREVVLPHFPRAYALTRVTGSQPQKVQNHGLFLHLQLDSTIALLHGQNLFESSTNWRYCFRMLLPPCPLSIWAAIRIRFYFPHMYITLVPASLDRSLSGPTQWFLHAESLLPRPQSARKKQQAVMRRGN